MTMTLLKSLQSLGINTYRCSPRFTEYSHCDSVNKPSDQFM